MREIGAHFLYRCAHSKTAGAIRVTKDSTEKHNHTRVRDKLPTSQTAEAHKVMVIRSHMPIGKVWKRVHCLGDDEIGRYAPVIVDGGASGIEQKIG